MQKTKLASTLKRMFADHKEIEEKAEDVSKYLISAELNFRDF